MVVDGRRCAAVDAANDRVQRGRITEPGATVVKISGKKKLRTTEGRLRIKGRATVADGAVALVSVKVGNSGRLARSRANWKATVKSKPGRNVVRVTALGTNGVTSASAKIVVVRREGWAGALGESQGRPGPVVPTFLWFPPGAGR
jgi:hypothetical protein